MAVVADDYFRNGGGYLLWCVNAVRAAEMLGCDLADDGGFTIEHGEYSVSIVQADEKKETDHDTQE